MDTRDKIVQIIEHIRPYILADGGDLQFTDFKDGIVTVTLQGACIGCSNIEVTFNDGIKQWIMEEVPEVQDVILLQDEPDLSAYEF